MITSLSEAEATEVLKRGRLGRLGCITEEGPYVVPMTYIFEGDAIYSHTLQGLKVTALHSDPRVCLQTDEIEGELRWKSAIAFGVYEEITDAETRAWVVRRFLTRFPNLTPVESVPAPEGTAAIVVFKIRIEHVTGRAEAP